MATKRANGEGTIYEQKNRNRWAGEFSYFDTTTGKVKRKTFTGKTKKIVAEKGKEFLRVIEAGLLPEAGKLTVGEWIDRWLEDFIKPNVRIKSYEKYESCLRCYVKPVLGNIVITKLNAADVQRVFNDMLTKGGKLGTGISSSTVRATRRYLSMAFKKAVLLGFLSKNVINATDPPKLVKREIHPLDEHQVSLLLETAKAGEYVDINRGHQSKVTPDKEYHCAMAYSAIAVAVHTGMRKGEVFGLKWGDVDFVNNLICIRRNLVSSSTKGLIFEEPKTKGSKRSISVSVKLIRILERYRKAQSWFKNLIGDKYNETDLIFTNLSGNPVNVLNFTTRDFKKMLKQAELNPTFTFHDLRHTHATLLLKSGTHVKVVSERLGHSTITLTLDTYSHLIKDMQETAVRALDKILV